MWLCVDAPDSDHIVAVNEINRLNDDDEALNILEDTLNPQQFDPLDFWNHIQSKVWINFTTCLVNEKALRATQTLRAAC